ncbi:hypothetical protein FQR65_LT15903 [Abscondita terminalis]|nr:hypothetical protein FQR65_LT15903 [Abscondita terminalis]
MHRQRCCLLGTMLHLGQSALPYDICDFVYSPTDHCCMQSHRPAQRYRDPFFALSPIQRSALIKPCQSADRLGQRRPMNNPDPLAFWCPLLEAK